MHTSISVSYLCSYHKVSLACQVTLRKNSALSMYMEEFPINRCNNDKFHPDSKSDNTGTENVDSSSELASPGSDSVRERGSTITKKIPLSEYATLQVTLLLDIHSNISGNRSTSPHISINASEYVGYLTSLLSCKLHYLSAPDSNVYLSYGLRTFRIVCGMECRYSIV